MRGLWETRRSREVSLSTAHWNLPDSSWPTSPVLQSSYWFPSASQNLPDLSHPSLSLPQASSYPTELKVEFCPPRTKRAWAGAGVWSEIASKSRSGMNGLWIRCSSQPRTVALLLTAQSSPQLTQVSGDAKLCPIEREWHHSHKTGNFISAYLFPMYLYPLSFFLSKADHAVLKFFSLLPNGKNVSNKHSAWMSTCLK